MWNFKPLRANNKSLRLVAASTAVLILLFTSLPHSSADILQGRSAMLSTSELSAIAEYRVSFTLPSSITYGSLVFEVCSNDPIPAHVCTLPGGFDLSSAVLTGQTGATGFTIAPGATANRLVLTRVPAVAPATTVSFTLQNLTNPSSPGSYFIRLSTYPTADASGSSIHEGGLGFAIINPISVTATVPPYLTFCTGVTIQSFNCANTTGDYIDFGEFSYKSTSSGSSQILIATNAQSGYNITVDGTTMTSGTNEIAAIPSNDVSRPGTAQFGLNLTANSTPPSGSGPSGPGSATPLASYTQSNLYRFVDGETIASWPVPDEGRVYTVSYIVNVPKDQAPGIYVTTLTYLALGTF